MQSILGRAGLGAAILLLVTMLSGTWAFAGEDTLDLTKAVKIGSGKVMVIQFTDPDCPFCRKAEVYFQGKRDVTRYVFFLPLVNHPQSKGKVQYILSVKDKAKAFEEISSGTWDPRKLADITPEGIKLQEEHQRIAKANKMNSTPSFIIYGRIIEGFDLKRLEQSLR